MHTHFYAIGLSEHKSEVFNSLSLEQCCYKNIALNISLLILVVHCWPLFICQVHAINSYPSCTKWLLFPRHFQMHFYEWKDLYFDTKFTEVCYYGSRWQYISIGSGNGLASNRRQAIIWTNDDPVPRRIYAAVGGDELKSAGTEFDWNEFNWMADTGANRPKQSQHCRCIPFITTQMWFTLCPVLTKENITQTNKCDFIWMNTMLILSFQYVLVCKPEIEWISYVYICMADIRKMIVHELICWITVPVCHIIMAILIGVYTEISINFNIFFTYQGVPYQDGLISPYWTIVIAWCYITPFRGFSFNIELK